MMIKILVSMLLLSVLNLAAAENCSGPNCQFTGGSSSSNTSASSNSSSNANSGNNANTANQQNSQIVPPISQSNSAVTPSLLPIHGSGSGISVNNNAYSSDDSSEAMLNSSKANSFAEISPFQRNIQIRSGLLLKQYGYDLFALPKTYYPVNNLPLDTNYILGPGDQVSVQAWGSISVNYTATISSAGSIFIPELGSFHLAGVKAGSLERYLTNKIGSNFHDFSLAVAVNKIRSIQINVAGYAQMPGTYTVSSMTSLVTAIFASGGPTNNGSLRNVQLRRNDELIASFDMYKVLLKGDRSKDVHLLPGDMIYFPAKGNEVAIYDGVKVPGIYETQSNETILDIFKFAGGASYDNSKDKVILERTAANGKINVTDFPYYRGLAQMLNDGDLIYFTKNTKEYANSIMLIGNIANSARLPYKPGMRVTDVIPNKNALLTRSFWDSYSFNTYGIDHFNSDNSKEKTLNQYADGEASDSSSSVGINSNDNSPKTSSRLFSNSSNLFSAGPLRIPEADINWNYAAILRIDPKNYSTHILAFNLKQALDGNPNANLQLLPGDIINIISSKDIRNPIYSNPIFVFVDGEVSNPGIYELNPGESMNDALRKAGGVTPNAYLYGIELTRKSVQRKQQSALNQMLDQAEQTLFAQASIDNSNAVSPTQTQTQGMIFKQQMSLIGKMRQIIPSGRIILNNASANMTLDNLSKMGLKNGDTLYIPPLPDTIEVIGQVYNPSTLEFLEGQTVRDYIKAAGGENNFADKSSEYILTANGSLYGRSQVGWFGAFDSHKMNPGDTIIVPQNVAFGSTIQNLINWTQVISNFGITAAALTVFKGN